MPVMLFWMTSRCIIPMQMYPTVVTAEWLLDNLHNSNLQIFDVSFFEGLSIE